MTLVANERLLIYETVAEVGDYLMAWGVDLPEIVAKAARDPKEPGRGRKLAAQDALFNAVRRYFRKQKGSLQTELEKILPARKAVVDLSVYGEIPSVTELRDPGAEAALLELNVAIAQDGVELFAEQQTIGLDWDLVNVQAAEWAKFYTTDWLMGLDETTQKAVSNAVQAFVETPGMTLGDVMGRLPFGEERAQRVAVTEITRIYAEADKLAGEELQKKFPDVQVVATWWTNADGLVCDTCRPKNGKEITDGESPPAHPECRCWRSTTTRILDEAEIIEPELPKEPRKPDEPAGPNVNLPSVSDALEMPQRGKYAEKYRRTMDAIDSTHGDGELPKIPVKGSSAKGYYGQYKHYFDGRPVDIRIAYKGTHHETTLAHEIGHFLDHQAIGKKGIFESEAAFQFKSKLMEKWEHAISNSEAYQKLVDMLKNPTSYEVEIETLSGFKFTTKPDHAHTRYLLQPRELWARSYAQYIAESSGNEVMLEQITKEVGDKIYGVRQWSSEDFAPIKKAIDEIFIELGWMQ